MTMLRKYCCDLSRLSRLARNSNRLVAILGIVVFPIVVGASTGRERLLDMQPLVVSYYWPIARENGNPMDFTMTSPNIIDVLSSDAHGSREVRAYWRKRGKVLLNRVYPFRKYATEEEVYEYFATNMVGADGISIDEVVAHRLTSERQRMLISVLRRLRAAFPDQLIFVWDASRWSAETALLAQGVRDYCDVVMLEVYRLQGPQDFRAFERRRSIIERYAPGIRTKTLIGIGDDKKTCMSTDKTCVQRLEAQVRFLGSVRQSADLRGVAIYAPIYFTIDGQQVLDKAIREAFGVNGASREGDSLRP